jgi:hypothetical protein
MEIHKKEDYDMKFLLSIIENEVEESINIDFKAGDALSKIDAKKKEISKDISAFANSNGGIIIYGLNERNHKAHSFSFIDGNEFTKEWLEQIISSTIQRNIPDLKIFPIRHNGKIEETVYVVQIPESIEAPHICKDKKFYKRYNFESVAMEEYEVRNLYGRKIKSKLALSGYNIYFLEKNGFDTYVFYCVSGVSNIGEIEVSNYKINVYFSNVNIKKLNINWDQRPDNANYSYTAINDERIKISNFGNCYIYPNEVIDLIRFKFEIKQSDLEDVLGNVEVEFKILYPDGEDSIITNLKEIYSKLKIDRL